MNPRSDYFATIKIQQGRIRAAMEEVGIKSVAELSRLSGVSQSRIGKFVNFKLSPRTRDGHQWREGVTKICDVLRSNPDSIFPEHLDHEVLTNNIQQYVEENQLSEGGHVLPLQIKEINARERKIVVNEVLDTLTEREQTVLDHRFGLTQGYSETLEETGKKINGTRERARQIEANALRKLRHPRRLAKLTEVMDFVDHEYYKDVIHWRREDIERIGKKETTDINFFTRTTE